MAFSFRAVLCLVILNLSLIGSSYAQTQSAPKTASTGVKDLAAALVKTKSEEVQAQLLAQNNELADESLLAALKELATPLVQKGDYVEAQRIAHIAVRVAERLGDRHVLAIALCDLGSAYGRQMTRSAESLEYLQKSLAIFQEVGDKKGEARALQAMGIAYGLQRRNDLAVEYYNRSLKLSQEVGDRNLTALIFNSLGLAHSSMGHYEVGLDFYQQSRALSEELNDQAILQMALNNIATYYSAHGRYAEALEYLQKSLKILEGLGSDGDRRSLAYKLQNIGLIYRHQGQLDQALMYARRSLQILEVIDDKFGIANLQNNIGVIYKAHGLYDQSLPWFLKSLAGYESLQNTPGIARALNNIGDAYRLQGHYDQALEPLKKSFNLREANRDRAGMSLTLNNLGRFYEDQHKYTEMLEVSQRAASLAEEINGREELWDARDRVGRAFSALGQPEEARKSFLAAITTIESLRQEVAGGEQQQQSFLESKLSPWLGIIDLLVSEKKYTEALTFAEQSKARVLLDTLQGGRASLLESLSEAERRAEEEQRLKLVSLNTQLTSEVRRDKPDQSLITKLKAELDNARLEYEDFETRLYVSHPQLRVKRGEAPLINRDEMMVLLPDAASALLEYVVSERQTYLFVVTRVDQKNEPIVQVYELPINKDDLAKQTQVFREQLAKRDLSFHSSATKLYALLLKPAEAQLRNKTNLIIAPDNTLWDLPFQALVTSANHFLLEEAAVSYAPSLTVLREMTTRSKRQAAHASPATLLALGNPRLGNETISRAGLTLREGTLGPLPQAEQEVKALGRLYGVSRSRVYTGAEAREDRFKSEAGQAKILHFATHGTLNNVSPMYSSLALAEGGPNEDGLLEAWELMRLNLHADLAVLSACETARGRVGAGEGMIGLSWAMFIAGVPTIVVSQWKVESASTRDLMVNFHRSLISPQAVERVKPTKTEALRQSALKLMKNPETSHPFYWAGFVLVGDGR